MKINFEYLDSILSIDCLKINISDYKIELILDKIYNNICQFIKDICIENNIPCQIVRYENYAIVGLDYALSDNLKVIVKSKSANKDKYSLAIKDFNDKLNYLNQCKYIADARIKSLNLNLEYCEKKLHSAKYSTIDIFKYEVDDIRKSIKIRKHIANRLDDEIRKLIIKGITVN